MAWYDSAIFYHMYPLGMVGAEKVNDGGKVRRRFDQLTVLSPILRYWDVTPYTLDRSLSQEVMGMTPLITKP